MHSAQLAEEAAFADSDYNKFANQLAINQIMFEKYANPKHVWDWRQFGAMLLGDVRDKRLLDFGCGQGEESTYFAKMGAIVTAIDVSTVGIELANRRAAYNAVADRVTAIVMRCDPTTFPDESFDLIHGFGILHHVGLDMGLAEIRRLLKPTGRAVFFEHMGNSNLIERLKGGGHYTRNESPLRWTDIMAQAPNFHRLIARPYHILARLRRRLRPFGSGFIRRLDDALLTTVPPARKFASGVVVYVEK